VLKRPAAIEFIEAVRKLLADERKARSLATADRESGF
jgi:hypothetical protein